MEEISAKFLKKCADEYCEYSSCKMLRCWVTKEDDKYLVHITFVPKFTMRRYFDDWYEKTVVVDGYGLVEWRKKKRSRRVDI